MMAMSEYKNWEDLNFDERVKVIKAFQNTEDRNESDKVNPREEDVKDYYEDNTEKFGFGWIRMKGKLYNSEEWVKYQMDIKHPFHDTEETFEVYECPECGGHFLVESEAVECADRLWCPYCQYEFEKWGK